MPYDSARLNLFDTLFQTLHSEEFVPRPDTATTREQRVNRAFFESYFSNFIEGTRFDVEEARGIVLEGRVLDSRPADSHDILGTFRVISDSEDMRRIPSDSEEFIALLARRHEVLLGGRPEHHPGRFKDRSNRAGQTVFVQPELVRGTLRKGFEFYRALDAPFARAAFMMFMTAEVHPFLDGNGRIARVMMNADLSAGNQVRLIVPTVYREDYLLALRALSRQSDPVPYLRMLARAHAFSASLDFTGYEAVLEQLRRSNAFLEPDEGKLQF